MGAVEYSYNASEFRAKALKALSTNIAMMVPFVAAVAYGAFKLGPYGPWLLAVAALICFAAIGQPLNWLLIAKNECIRLEGDDVTWRSWTGKARWVGKRGDIKAGRKIWSAFDVSPACYFFQGSAHKGRVFANIADVESVFEALGLPGPPQVERIFRDPKNTRPKG